MDIKIKAIEQMTIEEFAEMHGLTMEVVERERDIGDAMRYYAYFDKCEVMEGGCLVSTSGNGATPEEAIQDYTPKISLTRIAMGAYTPDRKEIKVPRLKISTP